MCNTLLWFDKEGRNPSTVWQVRLQWHLACGFLKKNVTNIYSGTVRWEVTSLLQELPVYIHTITHLQAAKYNHSLIYWPLSSSIEALGVKGLAQRHLSGGDEGDFSPPSFIQPLGHRCPNWLILYSAPRVSKGDPRRPPCPFFSCTLAVMKSYTQVVETDRSAQINIV